MIAYKTEMGKLAVINPAHVIRAVQVEGGLKVVLTHGNPIVIDMSTRDFLDRMKGAK